MTPFGVFSIPEDGLIGFPPELQPNSNSFIFIIGDTRESMNAEYLLDSLDYDPRTSINLPPLAEDRVALLISLIFRLFDNQSCSRVLICLTVTNQIDQVKHTNLSDFAELIKNDCSIESPPCILYEILR